jgi:hypothetical protein
VKQIGIVASWIAGLVLMSGLLFFFTQNVQNDLFVKNVNTVLAENGEARRLNKTSVVKTSLGVWYRVEGREERAFVFYITHNGIFVPCITFTGEEKIEILPLNNHAKAVFQDIPKGFIAFHLKRIEKMKKELGQ